MDSGFSEAEKETIRVWARGQRNGTFRHSCPACSEYRKNKTAKVLSVTIEGGKVLAQCWHCHKKGAFPLGGEANGKRKTEPVKPVPRAPAIKTGPVKDIKGLTADAAAFLKKRGISQDTAEFFNLRSAVGYFRDLGGERPAIAFPYYQDKVKVYGHKVRCIEDKQLVCDIALKSLFGIQNVDIEDTPHIVICEGEFDPLAYHEAGVANATSVPNGAASVGNSSQDAAPAFLWSAREQIEGAKKVYISTDNDEPGEALGAELARRIGRHRCWKVEYPEGCKDANDVLMKHGGDVLRGCFENAKPWPVEGLYEADHFFDKVFDLFENGFGDKVRTGVTAVDEIYSVGSGLLTVITGIPGNGKSTFVDQMMINLARIYGHSFAICSFENPPFVHIGKLTEMLLQKHFFDTPVPGDKMTKMELNQAKNFINKHFKFFFQEDGAKATVDSIIDRIKTAVFRWGVKGVVIDPYNYIERPRSEDSETQFIDDILTRLRLTAQAYDLHIWFVAHPTKMSMDGEGNYQIPKGYSISGSAAWYSKADFGLTVHRNPTVPGEVKIVNWKTRFDWLGSEGTAQILYDNTRNVYVSDPVNDLQPWAYDEGFDE